MFECVVAQAKTQVGVSDQHVSVRGGDDVSSRMFGNPSAFELGRYVLIFLVVGCFLFCLFLFGWLWSRFFFVCSSLNF